MAILGGVVLATQLPNAARLDFPRLGRVAVHSGPEPGPAEIGAKSFSYGRTRRR